MAQSTGAEGDFTLGVASTDLDTATYKAVLLDVNGEVAVATLNARVLGILQNKPKTGEACAVRVERTSKCVVDGNAAAIAVGDLLRSNATGQGIKTVTNGHEVFAMALQPSTAAGDIIEVEVLNRQV